MKKSLLLTLFIWLGSGAAYYFALHERVEAPADWITAIVGSFTILFGTGCLRNILQVLTDKKLIASSARGSLPTSKKLIAISGPIVAIDKPSKTPFTDQEAVIFEYDIVHEYETTSRDSDGDTTTEKRSNLFFSGNVLTPCQIISSWATIKLLSYPTLEGFGKKVVDGEEVYGRAAEFIARTTFQDMTKVAIMKVISQAKDLFTDNDGSIDKHLQMAAEYELDIATLKEEVVLNGEEVCLVGCYDPQKQGIVTDFSRGDGICRIYKGGQKQALKKISSKIKGSIFGAFFFLVLVNAIIWFVLDRSMNSQSQVAKRTNDFINAISSNNLEKAKELGKFTVDVNHADSTGQTPLLNAREPEIAKYLIEKGALVDSVDQYGRTALMYSAMYGRDEIVTMLLEAGANPNKMDNYGDTPLSLATDNHQDSAKELLLKAGAKDESLNETNATRLEENSEPVKICLKYIAAIHSEDRETMKALYETSDPSYFDTVDFDVWKNTRAKDPILLQAFQKDDKANIKFKGGPNTPTQEYELELRDNRWIIVREKNNW